jgi:hypothetical protein
MFPNGCRHHTDRFDCCDQLLLGASELLTPPTNFPRFMNIHSATISRTSFAQVI